MPTVSIIFASGSGHTEYVCNTLASYVREAGLEVTLQRAEACDAESFKEGDLLILASGSWNTGGIEGQLQPFMHELVFKKARDVDLSGRTCTHIALGDERYFYTARAGEYLEDFLTSHGATYSVDPLVILNEPYGQEEKIKQWAEEVIRFLT